MKPIEEELQKETEGKVTTAEISVIIPIYNEADNISELHRRLQTVLQETGKPYEIIFVNDGSTDESLARLKELNSAHAGVVRIVDFSRNFGHQLAITAGFNYAQGKAAIVLDADLQDPPETIAEFIQEWEAGHEVVYGVRQDREGETAFKKWTASLFYKLLRASTSIDIPENAGDFYLLDRKILNILNALNERHRFMRGLVAWAGFKRKPVYYVRKARHKGKTKYPLWKMVKFSWDAMTSFSFTPLRFVSVLGAVISVVSFVAILMIIYLRLFTHTTVTGWSSLMATILFIGGIQLLALGIIGEYIARIGDDVKARPLYTVRQYFQ